MTLSLYVSPGISFNGFLSFASATFYLLAHTLLLAIVSNQFNTLFFSYFCGKFSA